MDARNLIELLEATTNPDPVNIAQAEERLSQVKKKMSRRKKKRFITMCSLDLNDFRVEKLMLLVNCPLIRCNLSG